MSNHFSAANLKHPGDDARLDLTDLFVFTAPDNPDRTVLIMDSNPFAKGDGFQAVRLSYAGDRLQMYLFLPATNSSPQKLLADFDGKNWRNNILPEFAKRTGTLTFPKFKLSYDAKLNKPLASLGVKLAFDFHLADFSAMAGEPLFVSEVKQKSFVEVSEEGTEAAAVTTVAITASMAPMDPPKPFKMVVDRPFFFVIADERTQSILFMGLISDPMQ